MRTDMAKVIVERPRFGGRRHEAKGYRKKLGRLAPDEMPRREGMRRRSGGDKYLNEHLAPLRRFLYSRVGRPWDRVFAEICERISRNSAVQDHVRDHVKDYVAERVVLIDGVPCSGDGRLYGRPLFSPYARHPGLYVCPRTGILKKVPRPPQRPASGVRPSPFVRLDEWRQCRVVDGAWHLVELTYFPMLPQYSRDHDVVLGSPVALLTREQVVQTYGAAVYAVRMRRLGKKEMRQLPIPLDAIG